MEHKVRAVILNEWLSISLTKLILYKNKQQKRRGQSHNKLINAHINIRGKKVKCAPVTVRDTDVGKQTGYLWKDKYIKPTLILHRSKGFVVFFCRALEKSTELTSEAEQPFQAMQIQSA